MVQKHKIYVFITGMYKVDGSKESYKVELAAKILCNQLTGEPSSGKKRTMCYSG